MSKSKFFIYGSGRWREIDLDTGHVSGWSDSKFIYLKRGKLFIAKQKAVLRGLKDLAIGRTTTVRSGVVLSQESYERLDDKDAKLKSIEKSCHCCVHGTVKRCEIDANFNKLLKPLQTTTSVQCNLSNQIGTQTILSNEDIINNEPIINSVRNINDIDNVGVSNTDLNTNSCKELVIYESDVKLFRSFIEKDQRNIFNVDLLLFDENDDYKMKMFFKITPIVNVVRDRRILNMLNVNKINNNIENNNVDTLKGVPKTKADGVFSMPIRKRDVIDERENYKCSSTELPRITQELNRKKSNNKYISENVKKDTQPKKRKWLQVRRPKTDKQTDRICYENAQLTNGKRDRINAFKEIFVDESDILLFRSFIENDVKNIFKVDLPLFDLDDKYKIDAFYKINPIVYVERDKNISNINTKLDKNNFARALGLCSVHEVEKIKRYKMRNRYNNIERAEATYKCKMKAKRREIRRGFNKKMKRYGKTIDLLIRTCSGREFSRLEDEAIVDWILNNKKATQVKGNQIWRELEPFHQKVTGTYRSWHSLRNRYLRYILPSLSALSVSSEHATELRAAAATGQMKKHSKNNSIFHTVQVKSAFCAGARPRILDETESDEPEVKTPRTLRSSSGGKRSPLYTELIRRFVSSTPHSRSDTRTDTQGHAVHGQTERRKDGKTKASRESSEAVKRRREESSGSSEIEGRRSTRGSLVREKEKRQNKRRLYNPNVVM